jgi:hypothetical protein
MELVELLAAAFPHPQPPEATLALYVDELVRLDSAAAARRAIEELYRDPNTQYLPTLGVIHEAYWKCRQDEVERRCLGTRALPPGDYPPPPPQVVEQFLAMGIDLRSILKPIPDGPRPEEGGTP